MKNILPGFIKKPKVTFQIIICLLCLGILYFPVFKLMVNDWIHLPDFSHGFFIPFISLYFVWQDRSKLNNLPVSPKNSGIIIMLLGFCLLLIGNLSSESFTMRFSFLVLLSGIILFLLGWPHLKTILFPIAFLIFMIPIPSILLKKITFPMQLFASNVATITIKQLGIPIFQEGNIICLANTSLEVAEACSGIRSMISLLALGTVLAYFVKKNFWQRTLIILSCFPIAIFVNALRITGTGILANYYGAAVAEGFFHDFSGYLLFSVAFLMLAGLNVLLTKIKTL